MGTAPLGEVTLAASHLGVATFTPTNWEMLSPGRRLIRAEYEGTTADGPINKQTVNVAGYYGSKSGPPYLTQDVYLSGLVGLNSVTIGSTSSFADSFDSSDPGGYAATQAKRARVLSNGTITLKGSKVYGNVLSANGNVVLENGSMVDGNVTGLGISGPGIVTGARTIHSSAPMTPLVPIEPCAPFSNPGSSITGNYSYNPKNGTLSANGQTVLIFAPGTYCFRSITLNGGATIQVNAGPVIIKLTGAVAAAGGSFANLTAIPANLRIESSYTGNGGVVLGGNNNAYLTLYAPNTDVSLQGSMSFGAVVGRTLTVSGSTALHYDNAPSSAGWAIWSAWGFYFGLPFYP